MTGATKEEREALVARLRGDAERMQRNLIGFDRLSTADETLQLLDEVAALQAENGELRKRLSEQGGML